MAGELKIITVGAAALMCRELAKNFGKPQLAVDMACIRNNAKAFSHLFVFSFTKEGLRKLHGLNAVRWKNHITGRLALGVSIFSQEGYEI